MAISESLWSTGRVQDVYYRFGRGMQATYFKAPIQLWKNSSGLYITTQSGGSKESCLGQLAETDEDLKRMWKDNWDYQDPEPFRIGEHEFGDYEGRPNDWVGVFKFSRV